MNNILIVNDLIKQLVKLQKEVEILGKEFHIENEITPISEQIDLLQIEVVKLIDEE